MLEYALGADPKTNDAAAHTPLIGQSGGYLTLTYTRPTTIADIGYNVGWSSDLQTWITDGSATQTMSNTNNGDGTTTVVIRSTALLIDSPRQFLRLIVTRL